MPTPIAITLTLALFAGSLFALRLGPGYRAWPRTDQKIWAVLVLTVWPWIFLGFITHQPRWYTDTVLIIGGATTVVFFVRSARDIRRARTDLDRISTEAAQYLREHGETP